VESACLHAEALRTAFICWSLGISHRQNNEFQIYARRMEAIPRVVAQAKANLQHTRPSIYTETSG